ncbi:MAG: hypothetical protein KJI71_01210 [Patescibacteria group bacterium]|nr:hypothetical protein [Patescibacteria group bacterium]
MPQSTGSSTFVFMEKESNPSQNMNSWWNYDTGNETINSFAMFNSSNNVEVNTSLVNIKASWNNLVDITLRYDANIGILVGMNISINDPSVIYYHNIHRYSFFNYSEYAGSSIMVRQTTDQKVISIAENVTAISSVNYTMNISNLQNYILNNETIKVYNFDGIIRNTLKVSYGNRSRSEYYSIIQSFGNGTTGRDHYYSNGTVISTRNYYPIDQDLDHVWGYFAPSLYRVVESHYDYDYPLGLDKIGLDSLTLLNKKLIDYSLYDDKIITGINSSVFTTKSSDYTKSTTLIVPTSSSISSSILSNNNDSSFPIMITVLLIPIIVLYKKRR